MPEPLDEHTEETWLAYLNKFEQEIYPALFEPRGYTKNEALMFWSMNTLTNDIGKLLDKLDILLAEDF